MEWPALKKRLVALAHTEPLIMRELSIAELPETFSYPLTPTSVYLGIGLTGRETVSQGLPFDTLSMLLIAEKYREATGAKTLICLIADSHALTNQSVARESVEKAAKRAFQTISLIGKKLALPIEVIRASTIDGEKTYLDGLRQTETVEPEYAQRELADILYLIRTRGLILKLGWAFDGKGLDERFFDKAFRDTFPKESILFAYVEAGRTFNPARPKAPPYICTDPLHRLLLESEEETSRKLQVAVNQNGKITRYLEKTAALCSQHPTLAYTQKLPLTEQIQEIILTLCS